MRPRARSMAAAGRGPTTRDRRRPRRPRPRRARRRDRGVGERVHAGAVGGVHRMQRLDRERHVGGARMRQQRRDAVAHLSRAPAMSLEPFGRPPATSTRQRAPMAAASSTARRLSSIAARRPASSAAGNMPPRQRQVTVIWCVRISSRARLDTADPHDVAPGRDRGNAGARAAFDQLLERPRLHGRRVDRQPTQVVARDRASAARRASPSLRACARRPDRDRRSRPAASASRNSSARCKVERALSWPPTMVK